MSQPSWESNLRKLGLELPPAPKAVGGYVTVIRTGNLVLTAGQLPWKDGKLLYTGKLGVEVSVEQGYAAARMSGLVVRHEQAERVPNHRADQQTGDDPVVADDLVV